MEADLQKEFIMN